MFGVITLIYALILVFGTSFLPATSSEVIRFVVSGGTLTGDIVLTLAALALIHFVYLSYAKNDMIKRGHSTLWIGLILLLSWPGAFIYYIFR
jgi:hypothetical protein